MGSIRDIVNSIFDPRSSGMMIMSYIETPKEEYKKQFDLVVKQVRQHRARWYYMTDDRYDNRWSKYYSIYSKCFKLKSPGFTKGEIEEMNNMLRSVSKSNELIIIEPDTNWGWDWEWEREMEREKEMLRNTIRNECLLDFHEAYRFYMQCKEGQKSVIALYEELYHESMNKRILEGDECDYHKTPTFKYRLGYRVKADPTLPNFVLHLRKNKII